eukprot:TRINITY_DN29335_c0_g1_i2.p1 TRINITY_DN29335_c0_g1~~TRINITY_DN29335_c0_g1_i2.p1  ORF type:complete len:238 (+),score=36.93 TRINITY_DN29335_c0_g1_i2:63-776(+)
MTVRTTDKATKSDVKATKDPQGERSDGLDMAVKAVAPSKNLGALVSLEHHANYLVKLIGAPSDELCSPWVRWLAMLNGVLHFGVFVVQFVDRARFPTKRGEKKVATFEVMNDKYVGLQFAALVLHILSGTISHFGSSAAIALEDYWPKVAQRLAVLSSAAELGVHSPSALCMSPFVYGDKGVTPLVYAASFLEDNAVLSKRALCCWRPIPSNSNPKHVKAHHPPAIRRAWAAASLVL